MTHDSEDFDDGVPYHNDDLTRRAGLVTVWLNAQFEEDNEVIGWFDHDHAEGGGPSRPVPIRELLAGFSYAESWRDAALTAAEKLGVAEARYAWMLFDYEYAGPPGRFDLATEAERIADQTPYYLGAFPFSRR